MPRDRRSGMAELGVKLDHVATLRQARGGSEPNLAAAAILGELGGADWFIVHLREDRRHIQERDLHALQQVVASKLTLEISLADRMLKFALEARPARVTLVPEQPLELTTEGGLDLIGKRDQVYQAVAALRQAGIAVALLVQPLIDDIKTCHRLGHPGLGVELNTTSYIAAKTPADRQVWSEQIIHSAKLAAKLGMPVQIGHALSLDAVRTFAATPEIAQYNVGHALAARAMLVGMEQAVREMKTAAAPKG
ncbi:MAG: pyridoxine 5'-phosphate synthase [Nitrospiria bacterium]